MIKITFLFLILIGLNSCQKETFQIKNLSGNTIIAVGHGGMGFTSTFPLNTYESILQCLTLGLDGTEIDIQLTKDNVLVAFHDEKLDDNTNLSGYVRDFTWHELQSAYYTNLPYLNYRIISMDQLFSSLPNAEDYRYVFDCKLIAGASDPSTYQTDFIEALVNIVSLFKLEQELYIESNSILFLTACKVQKPDYLYLFINSSFENALQQAIVLNLSGISIDNENISADQVLLSHAQHKIVSVWNVHYQPDNIDAIKKSVDIIQSDSPRNLYKLLNR